MSSTLPELPAAPRVSLPAAQMVLEAYWHIGRHARTYAGQVFVLSAIGAFLHLVTLWLLAMVMPRVGFGTQVAAHQLVFVVTIVTVLVLGGTAIFIDCQRAIVLGHSPAVGHALKLRPGETRMLRAICIYWLVVHLVPTAVVQTSYVADALQLAWVPRLSMPAKDRKSVV